MKNNKIFSLLMNILGSCGLITAVLATIYNLGMWFGLFFYIIGLWSIKDLIKDIIVIYHGKASKNFNQNLSMLLQGMSVSTDPRDQDYKFVYKQLYLSLEDYIKINQPKYIYQYVDFIILKYNEILKTRNMILPNANFSKKILLKAFKELNKG